MQHKLSFHLIFQENCKHGALCLNRDFSLDGKSKYEIETTVTSWGGTGVIASGKIPRGHFIIEYIGEIITKEESQERLTEDNRLGITNFYQIVLGNGLFRLKSQLSDFRPAQKPIIKIKIE